MKHNNKTSCAIGCSRCPYAPHGAEQMAMAAQDPTTYCPDAYTEKSPECGIYPGKKEDSV